MDGKESRRAIAKVRVILLNDFYVSYVTTMKMHIVDVFLYRFIHRERTKRSFIRRYSIFFRRYYYGHRRSEYILAKTYSHYIIFTFFYDQFQRTGQSRGTRFVHSSNCEGIDLRVESSRLAILLHSEKTHRGHKNVY